MARGRSVVLVGGGEGGGGGAMGRVEMALWGDDGMRLQT